MISMRFIVWLAITVTAGTPDGGSFTKGDIRMQYEVYQPARNRITMRVYAGLSAPTLMCEKGVRVVGQVETVDGLSTVEFCDMTPAVSMRNGERIWFGDPGIYVP